MINEFTDADLDCEDCEGEIDCVPCDPLDTFSIDEDDFFLDISTLISTIGILRVIAGFFLYYYCKTGKGRE